MKFPILSVTLGSLFLVCLGLGQVPGQATAGAKSLAYHSYRQAIVSPPFGLRKVEKLIRQIKTDGSNNSVLSAKDYNRLTVDQKFTYAMVHAENFDQNCDVILAMPGEERKIFAHPIAPFDDSTAWSERQIKFLHSNRRRVVTLLRRTIRTKNRVGSNLKQAILEINAYQVIPDLLAVFKKNRKDMDILSVCMLLMMKGHYRPFTSSATYKKLYADSDASWKAVIDANVANQNLEMRRATGYFRSKVSQSYL